MTNYTPTLMKRDDKYILNAIHIREILHGGYKIIQLKKPTMEQEEMEEEILYENDELTLEKAKSMAMEYAIEENEENGNFFKFIFLPIK